MIGPTYSVGMNGLNLSRVFVTKFLGVHMDSKLDWNYHIDIVRNKVAKNVSVMNRVKHVLTSSALYSLYCTLVMPYLTYCCEVWGNNYKTRIQSLFILQKKYIRICLNTNYKCHTKPLFYQLRSLNVFDIIDINSPVFMYKAFHNLLPTHLLTYFKKVNDSRNHNTRNNTLSFKVRFRRTSKKALIICIKGSEMWNALSPEINNFSTLSLNCRSLSKIFDKLECSLKSLKYKFDCIGLTETWLKEMESTDVYNMSGYSLLSKPRTNKRGGGVGMFVSSGLNFKLRDDLHMNSASCGFESFYRSPNSKKCYYCRNYL